MALEQNSKRINYKFNLIWDRTEICNVNRCGVMRIETLNKYCRLTLFIHFTNVCGFSDLVSKTNWEYLKTQDNVICRMHEKHSDKVKGSLWSDYVIECLDGVT